LLVYGYFAIGEGKNMLFLKRNGREKAMAESVNEDVYGILT
jgi:hypothetical protein